MILELDLIVLLGKYVFEGAWIFKMTILRINL